MTTYSTERVTCCVCGTASDHEVLMSTNTFFGSPDLDLRPPEMKRSTMASWLQECPKCGFVSADLSTAEDGVRELVAKARSDDQRDAANAFTRRCLRRCMLDEELGKLSDAANHALWAAWSADDRNARQEAAAFRLKATKLFIAAVALLPARSEEWVTMRTRTVDVLRRAGEWEEAAALADAILAEHDLDPTIERVVSFGRRLVQNRDSGLYTIDQALQ